MPDKKSQREERPKVIEITCFRSIGSYYYLVLLALLWVSHAVSLQGHQPGERGAAERSGPGSVLHDYVRHSPLNSLATWPPSVMYVKVLYDPCLRAGGMHEC